MILQRYITDQKILSLYVGLVMVGSIEVINKNMIGNIITLRHTLTLGN